MAWAAAENIASFSFWDGDGSTQIFLAIIGAAIVSVLTKIGTLAMRVAGKIAGRMGGVVERKFLAFVHRRRQLVLALARSPGARGVQATNMAISGFFAVFWAILALGGMLLRVWAFTLVFSLPPPHPIELYVAAKAGSFFAVAMLICFLLQFVKQALDLNHAYGHMRRAEAKQAAATQPEPEA